MITPQTRIRLLVLMISLANDIALAEACQPEGALARPDYDFTAGVSRWGVNEHGDDTAQKSLRINSITVTKLPIFDANNPDENNVVYQWVNDHHIYTRDKVVQRQLLFAANDVTTGEEIRESERLLRDRKFTSDASIRILSQCNNGVDLEVVTREVWTLTPEVSYSSAGGDSSYKFGVRDSNFLGSGRQFSTSFEKDEDRNAFVIRGRDPNYHGSRRVIDLKFANLSDGYSYALGYAQPFYALDTRTAWTTKFNSDKQTLTQYASSEKVSETEVTSDFAEMSFGWSKGIQDNHVNRFTLGLRHDQRDYGAGTDLPLPSTTLDSYDINYPFAAYEFTETDYARAYNINQIYRTEDLHIGKRFVSSLGYAPGSDSRMIWDGEYSDTLLFSAKVLLQFSMDWTGQLVSDSNEWQNSLAHVNLAYHRGQTSSRSLYIGLNSTFSHNLRNGEQVDLGGNAGLRGFDNHFLTGDHSTVFTIEQRLFTKTHPFNLVRLGYAAFVDVGATYGGDRSALDADSGEVFSNVGFGLRLAPSKSEKGQVIHVDLAYPISGDFQTKSRSLQFTAELKKSF
jgi:hypothetical protein